MPLAITYANRINDLGVKTMFQALIDLGGDTDTNCALAGQIVGTLLGKKGIPGELIKELEELDDFYWITSSIEKFNNERKR